MRSTARGPLLCTLSALFVALAGCDSAPNPDFERTLQNQQAEQAGDAYLALSNLPSVSHYLLRETNLRHTQATQQALQILAIYDPLLQKLDAETKTAAAADLLASCRPTFAEATGFHSNENLDAPAATATAIFDRLNTCRDAALAAAQSGNEDAEAIASILRRFASSGMVLVSVTTIARGNETAGLELWRRAEVLAVEDRPGFKLRARHLLGSG